MKRSVFAEGYNGSIDFLWLWHGDLVRRILGDMMSSPVVGVHGVENVLSTRGCEVLIGLTRSPLETSNKVRRRFRGSGDTNAEVWTRRCDE
ncbi:MAG: hypothetical protein U1F34_08305 [Gammaproteobacteria bacterium]